MKVSSRLLKWLGIGLGALVLILVVVWIWVIPSVIVGRIRAVHPGYVSLAGWWIDGQSAGVRGLKLHETRAADSPVWASAEKVSTDLSLGSLLTGKTSPTLVTLSTPNLSFRMDRNGQFLTKPEIRNPGTKGGSPIPRIEADDARVTFAREGWPGPMTVSGISARVEPGKDGVALSARTEDPAWGPWDVIGRADSEFASGDVHLVGKGVKGASEKLPLVPFVPLEVGDHVKPRGPVDVEVRIRWGSAAPIEIVTTVDLPGTAVELPTLGLTTSGTTGRITVVGPLARASDLEGEALGGRVSVNGTLDFGRKPPVIDLNLGLKGVDVTKAPPRWQLGEAGVTGRLDGTAHLLVTLKPAGADLTGSSGEGTILGGTLGGIPVKAFRLGMKAERVDLQYRSIGSASTSRRVGVGPLLISLLQVPKPEKPPEKKPPGVVLPKEISTQIELEDVDLKQVMDRVERMGIKFPVPVAGQLSLKADATIPLGAMKELKRYKFHGDLTLKGANIDGVDLGRLRARLDLDDGILELHEFRGILVDRPEGTAANPPEATADVPAEGPLPVGGFRATLRAELSPPGKLTGRAEANRLPLAELAAPFLPKPTPLTGTLSLDAKAEAAVASLGDPRSWQLDGRAESKGVTYRSATLNAFSTAFALKQGRLDVSDLKAQLGGRPLAGSRFGLVWRPRTPTTARWTWRGGTSPTSSRSSRARRGRPRRTGWSPSGRRRRAHCHPSRSRARAGARSTTSGPGRCLWGRSRSPGRPSGT